MHKFTKPCQYNISQLLKFPVGTYVRRLYNIPDDIYHNTQLGTVVGLTEVEYDQRVEIILLVLWADGVEAGVHPSNLEVLGE